MTNKLQQQLKIAIGEYLESGDNLEAWEAVQSLIEQCVPMKALELAAANTTHLDEQRPQYWIEQAELPHRHRWIFTNEKIKCECGEIQKPKKCPKGHIQPPIQFCRFRAVERNRDYTLLAEPYCEECKDTYPID